MKIIYLAGVRLPTKNAHGFQIVKMCSSFSRLGHQVILLIPWRKNLLNEDPFDFYRLPKNFRILKLPAIDLYPFRFLPEIFSSTVHLLSFFVSARFYLWFNSYELLYTRERLAGFFFKNFVAEIHAPEQMNLWGFNPKRLVVITHYIKNELVSRGIKNENIFVAPDAFDPEIFFPLDQARARQFLSLNLTKPMVVYCGNFKVWKGVDVLAEVVPLLPQVVFYLIGATKDSDLLRIREKLLPYSNAVVEGFKPQELIPKYLASADILVLPNTAKDENSCRYTSPLKLFEYMAMDRPIVASALPSLKEILNYSNAIFFEPDNPLSLSSAIKKVLSDPEKFRLVAHQSWLDGQKYTWDNRAREIIKFLV